MEVRRGNVKDVLDVAQLALVLWPDHSLHAMALNVLESIQGKDAAYFLAILNHEVIGLAYVRLRQGESYLEGLFLKEDYRCREYLMQLIRACEQWANEKGTKTLISGLNVGMQEGNSMYRYVHLEWGLYDRPLV